MGWVLLDTEKSKMVLRCHEGSRGALGDLELFCGAGALMKDWRFHKGYNEALRG